MYSKEITIQIGHIAQHSNNCRATFTFAQAILEEIEQEIPIEGIKRVMFVLFLHIHQTISQIIPISSEKSPCLDENKKHQTIQHE